jgi:hypothetical protein
MIIDAVNTDIPVRLLFHHALHFMTLFETCMHFRLKIPCAMPERRRREAMRGQSVARFLRKHLHLLILVDHACQL